MMNDGLRACIDKYGEKPALLSQDGQVVSFAKMGEWISRFSARLAKLGVGPGQKVVPLVDNTALRVCLWFAIWRRGADVVMAPSVGALVDLEIEHDHVVAFADQPKVGTAQWHVLDNTWRNATGEPDDSPYAGNLIFGTSGSTGRPKYMANSGEVWFGLAEHYAQTPSAVSGHSLVAYPDTTTGALTCILLALLTGHGVTFPMSDTTETLQAAADFGVTTFAGSPLALRRVVDAAEAGAVAPDFKLLGYSGASADQAFLMRAFTQFRAPLTNALGANECGTIALGYFHGQHIDEGWAGTVLPHVVCALRGVGQYDDLAKGAGRLAIQVPEQQRVQGYIGGAAIYDADGWFETGDIATLDADRNLSLVGRDDFLINVGGTKFSAERLEAALMRLPEVSQAGVAGEKGRAAVLVIPAKDVAVDVVAVVKTVLAELFGTNDAVKCELTGALPLLPSGKLDRAAILAAVS